VPPPLFQPLSSNKQRWWGPTFLFFLIKRRWPRLFGRSIPPFPFTLPPFWWVFFVLFFLGSGSKTKSQMFSASFFFFFFFFFFPPPPGKRSYHSIGNNSPPASPENTGFFFFSFFRGKGLECPLTIIVCLVDFFCEQTITPPMARSKPRFPSCRGCSFLLRVV